MLLRYIDAFAAALQQGDYRLTKEITFGLIERTPSHIVGDFAFPCFQLAKMLKKSPAQIAIELAPALESDEYFSSFEAVGPYINAYMKPTMLAKDVLHLVFEQADMYGSGEKTGKVALIESPSPNTNKPLHLGHVRNMILGNTLASIMDFAGYSVKKVEVVNDRGVHICKSMLAYKLFANNQEPDQKSDHFVGKWYVRFSQEEKNDPTLLEQAQTMLQQREAGDPEVVALWKKMRHRVLNGIAQTYKRYGTHIDDATYESDIYKDGKDIVAAGLVDGIFEKDEKGTVVHYLHRDPDPAKVKKLALLRSDGTSLYSTQDIALTKKRYDTYKMDTMIFVIGNEQSYYFQQLFSAFKALGYSFADNCYHFAYGMVYLPDGKMKSREGTVIDADDLADELQQKSFEELQKRYPDTDHNELQIKAESIAMGAIKFFFIKYDPLKDFVFDAQASISFEGETGPYVQYTHARCVSLVQKYQDMYAPIQLDDVEYALYGEDEKELFLEVLSFREAVRQAANEYKPNVIARYVLHLCQLFNKYYQKHQIVSHNRHESVARVACVKVVQQVIKTSLLLLGIDAPEHM